MAKIEYIRNAPALAQQLTEGELNCDLFYCKKRGEEASRLRITDDIFYWNEAVTDYEEALWIRKTHFN